MPSTMSPQHLPTVTDDVIASLRTFEERMIRQQDEEVAEAFALSSDYLRQIGTTLREQGFDIEFKRTDHHALCRQTRRGEVEVVFSVLAVQNHDKLLQPKIYRDRVDQVKLHVLPEEDVHGFRMTNLIEHQKCLSGHSSVVIYHKMLQQAVNSHVHMQGRITLYGKDTSIRMEVSRKPGGPTWFAIRFQPAIAVDRDDETDMYMYIPHTNVSKEDFRTVWTRSFTDEEKLMTSSLSSSQERAWKLTSCICHVFVPTVPEQLVTSLFISNSTNEQPGDVTEDDVTEDCCAIKITIKLLQNISEVLLEGYCRHHVIPDLNILCDIPVQESISMGNHIQQILEWSTNIVDYTS